MQMEFGAQTKSPSQVGPAGSQCSFFFATKRWKKNIFITYIFIQIEVQNFFLKSYTM